MSPDAWVGIFAAVAFAGMFAAGVVGDLYDAHRARRKGQR
jgi:hypothetical protein